jgi:hypothetical protein
MESATEIKFTSDGKKVVVLGKLNSTDYIVQEIFIIDGSEIPSGEHFVTKSLHDAPAVPWKEKNLRDIEANYETRKRSIEADINSLEKKYKSFRDRVQLHVSDCASVLKEMDSGLFEDLVSVCSRRISHVVMNAYEVPMITDFDTFQDTNEYGLKLLTLWGYQNGSGSVKYSWKINEYPDGSGRDRLCFFCQSFDEAKRVAVELLSENDEYSNKIILALREYGAPIDPEKLSRFKEKQISCIQKTIQGHEDSASNSRIALDAIKNL